MLIFLNRALFAVVAVLLLLTIGSAYMAYKAGCLESLSRTGTCPADERLSIRVPG